MRLIRPSARQLLFIVLAAGLIVFIAGGAVAAVETDTVDGFWHGAWWALSLMMTVGFVESEPLTTVGRMISAVLMITGFVLLATVTATIASMFVRGDERPEELALEALERRILVEIRDAGERLARLEKSLGGPGGPDGRDEGESAMPEPGQGR